MTPRIIKPCAVCGKEMSLTPSMTHKKTCSNVCKFQAKKRVNLSEEKKAEIVEMILRPPRSNWSSNIAIARALEVGSEQVKYIRANLEKFMEKTSTVKTEETIVHQMPSTHDIRLVEAQKGRESSTTSSSTIKR